MAKKKKTYKVTVVVGWMDLLKRELKAWGINPQLYTLLDDTQLTTKNSNVLDVVTETFLGKNYLYQIKECEDD